MIETIGVHRFYVGKIGIGILIVLAFGGCEIWTIVDIAMIACGKFTDSEGNLITADNRNMTQLNFIK